MRHRLLYKQKEGAIVPKKYTKTEDGWTRVEEVDEIEEIEREFASAPSDDVLAKNNYYNKFKSSKDEDKYVYTDEDLDAIIAEYQASRMPTLEREKSVQQKQNVAQKAKPKETKTTKDKVAQQDDFDKETTKMALIAVAWIFGIMALLVGGLALWVELSTTVTWQGIAEWIALAVVKFFYYLFKVFYSLCEKLFNWIFFDVCNASF